MLSCSGRNCSQVIAHLGLISDASRMDTHHRDPPTASPTGGGGAITNVGLNLANDQINLAPGQTDTQSAGGSVTYGGPGNDNRVPAGHRRGHDKSASTRRPIPSSSTTSPTFKTSSNGWR